MQGEGDLPEAGYLGAVGTIAGRRILQGWAWRRCVGSSKWKKTSAHTTGGGPELGPSDVAGCVVGKTLTPDRRRSMVRQTQAPYRVGERRACGVLAAPRPIYPCRLRLLD